MLLYKAESVRTRVGERTIETGEPVGKLNRRIRDETNVKNIFMRDTVTTELYNPR